MNISLGTVKAMTPTKEQLVEKYTQYFIPYVEDYIINATRNGKTKTRINMSKSGYMNNQITIDIVDAIVLKLKNNGFKASRGFFLRTVIYVSWK